jgi:hypothetical protein
MFPATILSLDAWTALIVWFLLWTTPLFPIATAYERRTALAAVCQVTVLRDVHGSTLYQFVVGWVNYVMHAVAGMTIFSALVDAPFQSGTNNPEASASSVTGFDALVVLALVTIFTVNIQMTLVDMTMVHGVSDGDHTARPILVAGVLAAVVLISCFWIMSILFINGFVAAGLVWILYIVWVVLTTALIFLAHGEYDKDDYVGRYIDHPSKPARKAGEDGKDWRDRKNAHREKLRARRDWLRDGPAGGHGDADIPLSVGDRRWQ